MIVDVTSLREDHGRRDRTIARFLWLASFATSILLAGCGRDPSPASAPPAQPALPQTHLSPPRQALKEWASLSYTPLRDLGEGLKDLNLKERQTMASTEIAVDQRNAAIDESRRFLVSILAPTFEAYRTALAGYFKRGISISPMGRDIMRRELLQHHAAKDPNALSDAQLLEMFWVTRSKMGLGSRYFTGIALNESFYEFDVLKDLPSPNEYANPFPDDRSRVGRVSRISCFDFDGAAPADEIKKDRKLLVLDIRLMLKTIDNDIAYPICLRMWWSTIRHAWTPWYCIEYNTVSTSYRTVF